MNIRRGLFRLWIVASVLWTLTAGVIFFQDVRSTFDPIKIYTDSYEFEFPYNTTREDARTAVLKLFKSDFYKGKPVADPEAEADRAMAGYYSRNVVHALFYVALAMFSVPAVTFVLGVLILWIAAGFRRAPASNN